MSESFNPKDFPNVTFLKNGEEFLQYEEGMLDPTKRYGKSDNVIYEMDAEEIADHIATTAPIPKVIDPIEMSTAFIFKYVPAEVRMQMGSFMQQAEFHYQKKDFEALVLLFDSLEASGPEELKPVVKMCRTFFEV